MPRKLGQANDAGVPVDEIYLAKLLQNAGAYGLVSCRGSAYTDARGRSSNQETAVACCAMGAGMLFEDDILYTPYGMIRGNDVEPGTYSCDRVLELDGYDIGVAFERALAPEGK